MLVFPVSPPLIRFTLVLTLSKVYLLIQVVGGMAWCLTSASVDVDFDVTFKENPSIGEKMFADQQTLLIIALFT